MQLQAQSRHAAAIQKAIELAVDPWESPVGYQDSTEAFERHYHELYHLANYAHAGAMRATGFSTAMFANEWHSLFAHGPCSVWVDDQDRFVMVGELKPETILERLISDVYQEIDGPSARGLGDEHSKAFGYWKLRQALWHLQHPIL
jgi:hypothetical protein